MMLRLVLGATVAAATSLQKLSTSPADLNLPLVIVEYTMNSAHCDLFRPVMEKAVAESRSSVPGVEFAQIDCSKTSNLCSYPGSELPLLEVWRSGELERVLRPSTHSPTPLSEFFAAIAEGPLPNDFHEVKEDGSEGELRLARNYGPYIKNPATPVPVYPQQIELSHAKGEVVLVGPENFDEVVLNSGEPWMVKFYSPRCPYSRAMAAEWQRYTDTGLFNIAEFDCLQEVGFCMALGIEFWPTILYINGEYRREFFSQLSLPHFEAYHQMQSGAQIVPTRHHEELKTLVDGAASKGYASFVYMHDEATTFEDWDALVNQTSIFSDAQSTLIRSDNEEVRQKIGLSYSGSNLVFAGKTVDDNNEDLHYYHTFPQGHEPETLRDYALVKRWVNTVRFSQPVILGQSQLEDINEFANVQAVLIAQSTRHEKFKELRRASRVNYDAALAFQRREQARLRDERHAMHAALKKLGKKNQYRKVYQTPIHVPLQPEMAFSYIPKAAWDAEFGEFIDTSGHLEGDIILVNFAKGIYVDNVAGEKLQSYDPSVLETNSKPFLRSVGLPVIERRAAEFQPRFNLGDRLALMPWSGWALLSCLAVVVLLLLAKIAVRVRRRMQNRLSFQLPRYSKLE